MNLEYLKSKQKAQVEYFEDKTVFKIDELDFILVWTKATEDTIASLDFHIGDATYFMGLDSEGNLKDFFDLPKVSKEQAERILNK